EGGLAAATGAHERNQFPGRHGNGHLLKSGRVEVGIARRGKILADTRDAKRGAFGGGIAGGHTHLFFPSPRPSPPGRGRIVSHLWYIHSTDFATLMSAKDAPAAGCSLSPRERAGVRGNDGSTATEYCISVGLLTI